MKLNKAIGIAILGASIVGQQLAGAPLRESQVAADAKWLAHVDVEAVMKSPLGGIIAKHLKTEIARNNASKISIDVDMALAEVRSITAYGATFEPDGDTDAVVVLETGDKLPAILDGLLAHESLTKGDESGIKLLDDKPYATYLVGDDLYVANPKPNLILASKRFEEIEKAFAVVMGEAPSVAKSKKKLLLNTDNGFFLVASAVGLDQLDDLPPQARILQKTTGVQVSLGLDGDEFRAKILLSAASPEIAQQLFRIVQGMIALLSFTQVDNEGMAAVMQRVQVKQGNEVVAVDFRYPVEDVMRLIEKADGGMTPEEPNEGPTEKPAEKSDAAQGMNDREPIHARPDQMLASMTGVSRQIDVALACGQGKGD